MPEQNPPQQISEFKSKSGIKRIFSAFSYSLDGNLNNRSVRSWYW